MFGSVMNRLLRPSLVNICKESARLQTRQMCTVFDDPPVETQSVERLEKTVNQVMLVGRTGAAAEKRGSETHPVVTFSLATHTNFRKGEDLIQQTEWHRIAVFKPYLRETIYRYLKKGQRVMVQGRIGYLERRDPENDKLVVKSATIIAEDVIFFSQ